MIGLSSVSSQVSLQQERETQLLQQMNSLKGTNQDAKIEKSARQFEAMLLSNWLQQAEQSFATVPGVDDDDDGDGKSQLMSLGVQSLADSLAASGGIGIAAMISKALHATAEKAQAESGTKDTDPVGTKGDTAPAEQIHQKI
jgi:Rod binding domain-containing protein